MSTPTVVAIVAAVVVVLLVIAVVASLRRTRSSSALQREFGPEYGRTIQATGDRRTGERVLSDRKEAHQRLDLQPLTDASAQRYRKEWEAVQAAFVDRPSSAVSDADALVASLMAEQGYPVEQFDERAALVSVDHPEVVHHYRSAHAVLSRAHDPRTSTDELRQAFVHYRALFAELLGTTITDDHQNRSHP